MDSGTTIGSAARRKPPGTTDTLPGDMSHAATAAEPCTTMVNRLDLNPATTPMAPSNLATEPQDRPGTPTPTHNSSSTTTSHLTYDDCPSLRYPYPFTSLYPGLTAPTVTTPTEHTPKCINNNSHNFDSPQKSTTIRIHIHNHNSNYSQQQYNSSSSDSGCYQPSSPLKKAKRLQSSGLCSFPCLPILRRLRKRRRYPSGTRFFQRVVMVLALITILLMVCTARSRGERARILEQIKVPRLVVERVQQGPKDVGGTWRIPASWLATVNETTIPSHIHLHPTNILQAAELAAYLAKQDSRYIPHTEIPLIVHQTWKTTVAEEWPDQMLECVESWLWATEPVREDQQESATQRRAARLVQLEVDGDENSTEEDGQDLLGDDETNHTTTSDHPSTTTATTSTTTTLIPEPRLGTAGPDSAFFMWDDHGVSSLVNQVWPIWSTGFHALPANVMRADAFRILVVRWFGGIYADADTLPLRRPSLWLNTSDIQPWTDPSSHTFTYTTPIRLLVGIEADTPTTSDTYWRMGYGHAIELTQWALAGAAAHPVLIDMLKSISETADQLTEMDQLLRADALELTGPVRWTDCVIRYLSDRVPSLSWPHLSGLTDGGRSKIAGDVLVLPITGFSPGRSKGYGNMGSKPTTHPDARLVHLAKGSWKHFSLRVEAGKICRTLFGLCRGWSRVP
ncbi:hypothetical protein DFS34DRAFT_613325 [Phlyctochytrium arcticum]|nr:hypothetical protein DFS34DRAFT_613325 [Phlyctochytrium arcticum]